LYVCEILDPGQMQIAYLVGHQKPAQKGF
jgi:hypothetical protein